MFDIQKIIEEIYDFLHRIFGLKPGWHRDLSVVGNSHSLARSYIAQGKYKDAVFRLKFMLWFAPDHKSGMIDLAKAYSLLGEKESAIAVLGKLLAIDANNNDAKMLKEKIISGKNIANPDLEIAPEVDSKIFYKIHKQCFPVYWKEKEISDMLMVSGTKSWLARIDNKPVGMLMMRAQFEQAEILTIAVLPSEQKKSIAKRLMLAAEKEMSASGVKKIFLEVAENNNSAYALYLKIGYSEISRRHSYYRQIDGSMVDALVMAKEL